MSWQRHIGVVYTLFVPGFARLEHGNRSAYLLNPYLFNSVSFLWHCVDHLPLCQPHTTGFLPFHIAVTMIHWCMYWTDVLNYFSFCFYFNIEISHIWTPIMRSAQRWSTFCGMALPSMLSFNDSHWSMDQTLPCSQTHLPHSIRLEDEHVLYCLLI